MLCLDPFKSDSSLRLVVKVHGSSMRARVATASRQRFVLDCPHHLRSRYISGQTVFHSSKSDLNLGLIVHLLHPKCNLRVQPLEQVVYRSYANQVCLGNAYPLCSSEHRLLDFRTPCLLNEYAYRSALTCVRPWDNIRSALSRQKPLIMTAQTLPLKIVFNEGT